MARDLSSTPTAAVTDLSLQRTHRLTPQPRRNAMQKSTPTTSLLLTAHDDARNDDDYKARQLNSEDIHAVRDDGRGYPL